MPRTKPRRGARDRACRSTGGRGGVTSQRDGAPLLTIGDVAARYSCDPRTVRRWWAAGVIPRPIKLGGLVRWRTADLERHEQQLAGVTSETENVELQPA